MTTIDENIDIFCKETDQSINVIIQGSDEHLDLILAITTPLEGLAAKFEKVNEYLYTTTRQRDDYYVNTVLLPQLKTLNKSCLQLIGALRTSFMYRDVRQSLRTYQHQYDFFREILNDIQNFRIKKDDELDSLLKEINDL